VLLKSRAVLRRFRFYRWRAVPKRGKPLGGHVSSRRRFGDLEEKYQKFCSISGKVTVGTFKGFLAIFTKDLSGQKLSARVAGKWLVKDPITKYKSFDYLRKVRFTGAGYDIFVDLYLNGSFLRRELITTR